MAIFDPQNHTLTARHCKLYALYEIAFTVADFSAALLFLVGSVLFFYPSLENQAIWCFVVGSAFFALKPTLRLARELHDLAIGDYADISGAAKK